QLWVFNRLLKKAKNENIFEKLSLQVNEMNKKYVLMFLQLDNVEIFHRDELILPVALIIVDQDKFLSLTISDFGAVPKYQFGVLGHKVTEDQIRGMEYIFDSFLRNQKQVSRENIDNFMK
ncbi:MAG: hypothetical protein ACTSWN_14395, partial [Promethearchaeota archaeon]